MTNPSTTLIATGDSVAAPLPDAPGLLAQGRTELKYSVPAPIADAALRVARGYLPPDVFALAPQQQVTSLYLDTAYLTFLRWHRERAPDRFKLRIRRYGDRSAPTLYAEVKRKTGSIVRKHRAAFPADALYAVLKRSAPSNADAWTDEGEQMDEFVRHRSQHGAVPTMLVTGIRESLRDPQDGTAVTVDRDLRYQPTCHGDLAGDGGAWQPIPLPSAFGRATALVELKYVLDPPLWMEALIAQFAPWRVSFSKYAVAMNASAPAGC